MGAANATAAPKESASIKDLVWIGIQVALVALLIRVFRLENPAFSNVAYMALGGFFINALLPLGWRLPFFSLLSMASVVWVFGPVSALWLFAIGGALIGLCHIPVPWPVRLTLLILGALGLGYARLDSVETPWSSAIWPILTAMFMFRLAIYYYDVKHDKKNGFSLSWSTAYFFMIPNVSFPLFPVVDYKKFQASHYNKPAAEIYQRGAKWMMRGALHLILYRAVYYYGLLDPGEVHTGWEFVKYMLSHFALYLRVSGQFHLIIGMLLLFGFNLPETHHLYYLSSSFNDFWRRINIYWKDFMMKLFYYPTYFKVRKMGETWALVISTIVVFFFTWVLHAYQWYWLRGSLLLEAHDMLFWGVLALFVIVNSVIEAKKGRKRTLGQKGWTVTSLAAHWCRVAVTFTIIALLWSLWSSETLEEWLGLWHSTGNAWLYYVLGIPAVYGLARLLENKADAEPDTVNRFTIDIEKMSPTTHPFGIVAIGVAMLAIATPTLRPHLPSSVVSVVKVFREGALNKRDSAMMERGYYENLNSVNQFNEELWARYSKMPPDWTNLRLTEAMNQNETYLLTELVPNTELTFKLEPLRINSLGMRDQEYTLEKPASTFRIAVLGSSHAMGSGIAQDEVFDVSVEERLNALPNTPYENYEILNFAVPGYAHTRQAYLLESKLLAYDPDLILYLAHPTDHTKTARHLLRVLTYGIEDIPFAKIREIFDEAGLSSKDNDVHIERELRPYAKEIRSWAYNHMGEAARKAGVPIVFGLWEEVVQPLSQDELDEILQMGEDAGMIVWDITDLYPPGDRMYLQVAEWDDHPNAEGHAMLADRVFELLQQDNNLVPLTGAPVVPVDEPAATEPSNSTETGD